MDLGGDLIVPTRLIRSLIETLGDTMWLSQKKRGRSGVLLSGTPVSGKTTACLECMRHLYHTYTEVFPDAADANSVPIIFVSVPPNATAKAMVGRFAIFLGLPMRTNATAEEIIQMVIPQMYAANTRLLVIDEIQNLAGKTEGVHHAAQVLKDLIEAVPVSFLYSGFNIENGPFFAGPHGEQFMGRSQLLRLHDYPAGTVEQAREWNGLLAGFWKRLGLLSSEQNPLQPLSSYIHERTGGRIGSVNTLLTRSAMRVVREQRDPADELITLDVMERIQLDAKAPNGGLPFGVRHAPD
ncbi:TniB family NTP-binding protein [Salinibacterium sp. ZJ450]|uniref:TniB family NTP-binding protein n=1 Tax=Salinibacterium sp. ZJ450 TaxID=2708338 RepID=UPI0014231B36|nr:TniB family NTP-binding protein [Salinibacterium sp. ZJ450]